MRFTVSAVLGLAFLVSTVALAAEWAKLDPYKISCDVNGINPGEVSIFSNGQIIYTSPRSYDRALVQRCNLALEQAKLEGKAVFISTEGEISPEDGFFVRQGTKSKSEVDF